MSFYSIAKEFPTGWLVTAKGESIVTASGEPIITESTRERIESMWDDDINVQGESTMDIVPPLRKVSVGIKNKLIGNIIDQVELYNLDNWSDPHNLLSLNKENSLRFTGDDDHQGAIVSFDGFTVQQCSYKLKLEYTLKIFYSRSSVYGSSRPDNSKTFPVEYGFKLVGEDRTYWLNDDGVWSAESNIKEDIQVSTESSKEIEINGFPISGKFIFYIKQTLKGYTTSRGRYYEDLYIENMQLTMDTGDDYEDSLEYSAISNPANNIDLRVDLPIADIPYIPNDKLIYSLYFTDKEGLPTRMWHTKGGNDYNTLVNHIVACALKYRQRPARRIGGEMFTGKHIDMNTVVQDDKYLMAGFYVNSIELNCLNDSYNSELVEMPGLLQKELPPEGDDCIEIANLGFTVKKALKCANKIVLLSTKNSVYTYDTVSHYLTQLFSYPKTVVDIFPADNSFALVDGNSIRIVDYRGITIRKWRDSDNKVYRDVATFMNKYIFKIEEYYDPRLEAVRYKYLIRPEYKYVSTGYRGRGNIGYTYLYEEVKSIEKSFSTIALNTENDSYLHDCRVNQDVVMTKMEEFTQIKSVSDYFLCMNALDVISKMRPPEFRIYRRDSLTDMTCIKYIPNHVEYCDHTLGEVAYSQEGTVKVWMYKDNTIYAVKNLEGSGSDAKALFYINGELYIVRSSVIYKLIVNQ